MLQQIIASSNSSVVYQPPLNFGVVLDDSINAEVDTQLFWKVYKAVDYPEVTCDKTYFFTFSSDHAALADGKCFWGKGNNLDLTDFEYLGIMQSGLQAETPFLLRFPDQANRLYLYYHVIFDRGISVNNEQETRAKFSTTGGLLHDSIWTDADPINVLGEDLPQDHTGYLKVYNVDNILKGVHYKEQIFGSNITGVVQVSTTVNGQDWLRGDLLDIETAADFDRFFFAYYGEYFKYLGKWWWVGTDQTKTGGSLTSPTQGLVICKSNENLELTEQIMRLDNGVFDSVSWFGNYMGDNYLHLYGTNINNKTTTYKRLDLRFLINHV